jgi:hypothetical protein
MAVAAVMHGIPAVGAGHVLARREGEGDEQNEDLAKRRMILFPSTFRWGRNQLPIVPPPFLIVCGFSALNF